jgi:hypothetical protein
MRKLIKYQANRPWRNALVATTALSVIFAVSSVLWNSGHPEWAFLLFFLAIWTLISVSWSNIRFAEESGSILAGIVDRNFVHLYAKVERLEEELTALREQSLTRARHIDRGLR